MALTIADHKPFLPGLEAALDEVLARRVSTVIQNSPTAVIENSPTPG